VQTKVSESLLVGQMHDRVVTAYLLSFFRPVGTGTDHQVTIVPGMLIYSVNESPQEPRQVQVDVLPPLPKDASSLPPIPHDNPSVPFANLRTFYHPASGVVILALDWAAFGTDFLSGFLALPLICVLSFIVTFPILYLIQTKWSRDLPSSALGKAFLGAFLVGLPFPITGTLLGAAVLALAGLPKNPVETIQKLASTQKSQHP
jgi:hypothetical protein